MMPGERQLETGEKQRAAPSTSKTPGPVPPQEGDIRPPFFCVWEGRTYGPCNPLKVLGFHPKPHKPFEKGLSENFTRFAVRCPRAGEREMSILGKNPVFMRVCQDAQVSI